MYNESRFGKRLRLFCSATVAAILKGNRPLGLEINRVSR
jgi:hypothetical protein